MNRLGLPLLGTALLAAACAGPPPPAAADVHPGPTPAIQRTPIGELPDVNVDATLAHAKELASDRYQGRAPGGPGEALTVAYLTDQFRTLGLKPGSPDGTFVQEVPLVGITSQADGLTLQKGTEQRRLAWKDDVVAWTKRTDPETAIDASELVFVGYGVVAPEYGWDDYKGLDVRGKTLVMLINDPPVPNPDDPSQLDPSVFGGRAMTYYGRWTYKFEIAAEKGAAGAIIIHDTDAAGYPFSVIQTSNLGERVELATPDRDLEAPAVEGWITNGQGRSLLMWAERDFDQLKAAAATREFQPVPLGVTASMRLQNVVRTFESRNVLARLDGRDPDLRDEVVVYTAHWDHLGIGPEINGDRIYNGAKDNAVGVGGLLEIARAFTKLPSPPKRSILFLATTAEEQGLLGSSFYVSKPAVPLKRTAAVINIDGLNVHGRTRDLTVIGYGASELDEYVGDAAGEQGRIVRPDPDPEKGLYFRSDHFSFAKAGVPALNFDEGFDFLGKPAEFSRTVRSAWAEFDYHKPSDVVGPEWDLTGAREDLKVFLAVGYRVAEAERLPEWKRGSEFRARRDAMLGEPDAAPRPRTSRPAPAPRSGDDAPDSAGTPEVQQPPAVEDK
ncbi:MAG: M28 family metallopeptidase [Vicinamibacterales bacterium]